MRSLLTKSLTEILQNRVFISRQIKVFTIEQVSTEWNIPIPTLYRYISIQAREKSRDVSRIAYKREPKVDRNLCQICFEPLKNHARCAICTQLSHAYSLHEHVLH